MARAKWVRCVKCGQLAKPREAVVGEKHYLPREVGTKDVMRCRDCAGPDGKATMCRDCCPSGHETRTEDEQRQHQEVLRSLQS